MNLCATTASDFDFALNQLECDFNSNGTLTHDTTDQKLNENLDTKFFQDFISMHSSDFSELSKQLKEFLEEKYIELPMKTDIFPVPKPSKNTEEMFPVPKPNKKTEPTYTVSLKLEYTLS